MNLHSVFYSRDLNVVADTRVIFMFHAFYASLPRPINTF